MSTVWVVNQFNPEHDVNSMSGKSVGYNEMYHINNSLRNVQHQ